MEAAERSQPRPERARQLWTTAGIGLTILVAVGLVTRLPLPVALAAGLAAVGAATAAAWPYAGLLLFVSLLFVRPEDFFPELVGMRLVLLIGSATFGAWALRSLSARRPLRWSPTLGWALAFAAITLASMVPVPAAMAEGATQVARLIMLLVLVTQLVDSTARLAAFSATLVALSAWLAGVALFNYYTGHGFLSPQGFRACGTGTFADPNDTALALVPALPLALAGLLDGRRWATRLAAAAAAGLLLWAIYLTNSRGGMLALGGTLLVFAVLRSGARGAALGGALLLALLLFGPSRMSSLWTADDASYTRTGLWAFGLQLFLAHPVLGVGKGEFTRYHELTAHNSFILALAELGLGGAICWVALFGTTLRRSWLALGARSPAAREAGQDSAAQSTGGGRGDSPLDDPRWNRVNQAVLASLAGYLIAAMFLSKTFFETPFLYLGLAGVTSGALLRRPGRPPAPTFRSDLVLAVVLTAVGILATWAITTVIR
jgi:O-antigen ligase